MTLCSKNQVSGMKKLIIPNLKRGKSIFKNESCICLFKISCVSHLLTLIVGSLLEK